jgi:hypothetical protein
MLVYEHVCSLLRLRNDGLFPIRGVERAQGTAGKIPLDRSQYSHAIEAARVVARLQLRARKARAVSYYSAGFESSPVLNLKGRQSPAIPRGPKLRPASCVQPARLATRLVDRARLPLHHIHTRTTDHKREQPGKLSHAYAPAVCAADIAPTIAGRLSVGGCSPVSKDFFRTWQKN